MSQELKVEFPQDLQDDLTSLTLAFHNLTKYENLSTIVSRIHLATNEMMAKLPLNLLYLLSTVAQQMNSQTALQVINKEIQMNLEMKILRQQAESLKQSIMQEQGWTEKDWDKLNDWQKLID